MDKAATYSCRPALEVIVNDICQGACLDPAAIQFATRRVRAGYRTRITKVKIFAQNTSRVFFIKEWSDNFLRNAVVEVNALHHLSHQCEDCDGFLFPRLAAANVEQGYVATNGFKGAPLRNYLLGVQWWASKNLLCKLKGILIAWLVHLQRIPSGDRLVDYRQMEIEVGERLARCSNEGLIGKAASPFLESTLAHFFNTNHRCVPVFCHGDFTPANILVGGGEICPLDFEYSEWGTAGVDLAALYVSLLAMARTPHPARRAIVTLAEQIISDGAIALNVPHDVLSIEIIRRLVRRVFFSYTGYLRSKGVSRVLLKARWMFFSNLLEFYVRTSLHPANSHWR